MNKNKKNEKDMENMWQFEEDFSEEKIHQMEAKHYKLSIQINSLLLGAHVCLFLLFTFLHVTLMMYVNVVSVFVYLILFFYYKKNIVNYVFIVFVEVLVHMALATICVGMNGGFHFYNFCLIPCIFLCDYLSKTDGRKTMHPYAISVIIMCVFLLTRFHCFRYGPIYHIENSNGLLLLYIYNVFVTLLFLVIYMSVFEKRILKKEKLLRDMATLDQLTQLPNRYLMRSWLENSFRGTNELLSVAMMDIDDFKLLNDTYGHSVGDEFLIELSKCIKMEQQRNIRFCRWGGEEFLFMATGDGAYENLYHVMEKIKKNISLIKLVHGTDEISATVTIGIAKKMQEDKNYEYILKRADKRLYLGKKSGKNIIIGEKIR